MLIVFLFAVVSFGWQMSERKLESKNSFSFYVALKHDAGMVAQLKARVEKIIDPLAPARVMSKREVMRLLRHPKNRAVELFLRQKCPG
jgi:hypothetical protein